MIKYGYSNIRDLFGPKVRRDSVRQRPEHLKARPPTHPGLTARPSLCLAQVNLQAAKDKPLVRL